MCISNFKKGKQVRTYTVKDEKVVLVANCRIIWPGGCNFYSHLLNMHAISVSRQTKIHTAEPLVPETLSS